MALNKVERRNRIRRRIRGVVTGTHEMPRLSVFRSNEEIYAQLIDDVRGVTLAAASSLDKELKAEQGTKTELSVKVGKLLAERGKQAGIERCAFDRGGYQYHGRVKALAEGAREGGLQF
ncbi:50S ribosomal protein L18 [bacterium]|nr:50S ribosomal protein L18 [bacterium]